MIRSTLRARIDEREQVQEAIAHAPDIPEPTCSRCRNTAAPRTLPPDRWNNHLCVGCQIAHEWEVHEERMFDVRYRAYYDDDAYWAWLMGE